jgi:hypothetical protein
MFRYVTATLLGVFQYTKRSWIGGEMETEEGIE